MTRQRIIWGLLFVALGWFVHFWPTFHTANESIRFYFVQAVVDHGVDTIDPVRTAYGMNNVDRAEFEGRGYLDKAPGLSFTVMPLYWVLTRLGMSTDFTALPPLYYLLHLTSVVVLAVFGIRWTYLLILRWTDNENSAWTGALVLGLCTPFTLYSTLFFGHGPAAALAIGSLWYLESERPGWAGALAGAMVLVDTPTAILATALGIWTGVRKRDARAMLVFGLAGMPFVTVQLAYNTWLFGGPFTFAYSMKATGDLAAIHSQGIYGFDLPRLGAIWGLLMGAKRGLFFHAPVLLLGLFCWRDKKQLLVIAGIYFLWIASFVDWPAGDSYLPRHLVPLTPFLAVGVGLTVASKHWARYVAAPLTVVAFAMVWAPLTTFPYAFQAFDMPVIELALPMLYEGHFSPTVGQWLGIPAAWSAGLVLVFVAAIVLLLKPTPRILGAAVAGVVLLGLLLLAKPEQTNAKVRSRMGAECLLGYDDTAEKVCVDAGGRYLAGRCACVLKK